MTRNQEMKCVTEHRQTLYEPEKVKVQIDPLGMTKYNIASAQETAWKFGWLEAKNYDPQDFCDRIYEMSVFRRRHGCQMAQFVSKSDEDPKLSIEPTMCAFRQMSLNKIFTPCPVPADNESIFCKEHKDEHKRLTLQGGRKMIAIAWDRNTFTVIQSALEFQGNVCNRIILCR